MNQNLFGVVDYLVFGMMLLLSTLIGVYFAFFAKQKQNTTSEYLLGGKTMGVFPISMSLIASYISGISLLGIPAEVYVFGTQYWILVVSEFIVSLTMAVVFLPVFYKLQITSSYEYLKVRFNEPVRLLGSIFFLIKMLFYIPVVIYVPALAFNQVTGINIHLVTPIVCCVCIFYTSLGGLKAVVWTDTLQTILMFGGTIIVMFLGLSRAGGFAAVLEASSKGDRLELFNMDPDPTLRHTFWTVLVGGYFNYVASCTVNQAMVQRCLAMPSISKANITVLILAIGVFLILSICTLTGLIAYTYFEKCDPITTKLIKKSDQVLPYFVMEISESIPGLPGLFVAGVFSAALSSMSTGLNSMTGVIFEDLVRPVLRRPMSEERTSVLMKVTAAGLGALCVALVLVVEHLGALIQAVQSLTSIVSGPLLGLFTLGMLFPWANAKGAAAGGVASFGVLAWISFGAHVHISQKLITFPKKSLSVEGCSADIYNSTLTPPEYQPTDPSVFMMYRLSYMWYTALGTVITIVVGMAVSCMTGLRDIRDVDPDTLSPVIHRFLPAKLHLHTPKELVKLNTTHDENGSTVLNQRDEKESIDYSTRDKQRSLAEGGNLPEELAMLNK